MFGGRVHETIDCLSMKLRISNKHQEVLQEIIT